MLKTLNKLKKPDFNLLITTLILTIFGIIMVYNASVAEANQLFGDKYYFLKLQLKWVLIGYLGLIGAMIIPLNWLKKIAWPSLVLTLILLILVLIPGIGNSALGARRWMNIGPFNLQPSELSKLTLSLYLAAWLTKNRPFGLYLLILGVVLGLIMLQPDLGTAIVVIFSSILVYYVSGANWIYLSLLSIIGGLTGIGLILSSPYRKARLLTFFDPTRDPLGSSYHIRQALIAIGSGGLFGLGLGQSRQKYQFLPQVATDSIFAVVAEELGFLGGTLVLIIFCWLIYKCFNVARTATDDFTRLLAVGISSWLATQSFLNFAAMLALVPLTGVPLPFISYGGSSLVFALTGIGLLLNISRYRSNLIKK